MAAPYGTTPYSLTNNEALHQTAAHYGATAHIRWQIVIVNILLTYDSEYLLILKHNPACHTFDHWHSI